MTPNDIANEMYEELNCASGVSVNSISSWFKNNIGKLNNAINTSFLPPATNSDDFLDGSTTLDENQKSIYKLMYYIRYYQRQIDFYTGAAGVQSILELSSDDGKVRMVDKNSLSKTYADLRKTKIEELNDEIYAYKKNLVKPMQVAGDDTVEGYCGNTVDYLR